FPSTRMSSPLRPSPAGRGQVNVRAPLVQLSRPFRKGGRREAPGDSIKQKNAGLCPAFSLVFRRVSFALAQQPVEDGAFRLFDDDRLSRYRLLACAGSSGSRLVSKREVCREQKAGGKKADQSFHGSSSV